MTRRLCALCLIMVVGSCTEKTPTTPLAGSQLPPPNLGVIAGTAALVEWAKLSPEMRRSLQGRFQNSRITPGEPAPPRVALASGSLPNGSDAIVLLDPGAIPSPTIVVSDLTVDGTVLGAAASKYYEVASTSGTGGPRRFEIKVRQPSGPVSGPAFTPEGQRRISPTAQLLERIAYARTSVTIPGIGSVLLLDLGQQP